MIVQKNREKYIIFIDFLSINSWHKFWHEFTFWQSEILL